MDVVCCWQRDHECGGGGGGGGWGKSGQEQRPVYARLISGNMFNGSIAITCINLTLFLTTCNFSKWFVFS